jgi:hypothetical protein
MVRFAGPKKYFTAPAREFTEIGEGNIFLVLHQGENIARVKPGRNADLCRSHPGVKPLRTSVLMSSIVGIQIALYHSSTDRTVLSVFKKECRPCIWTNNQMSTLMSDHFWPIVMISMATHGIEIANGPSGATVFDIRNQPRLEAPMD